MRRGEEHEMYAYVFIGLFAGCSYADLSVREKTHPYSLYHLVLSGSFTAPYATSLNKKQTPKN